METSKQPHQQLPETIRETVADQPGQHEIVIATDALRHLTDGLNWQNKRGQPLMRPDGTLPRRHLGVDGGL